MAGLDSLRARWLHQRQAAVLGDGRQTRVARPDRAPQRRRRGATPPLPTETMRSMRLIPDALMSPMPRCPDAFDRKYAWGHRGIGLLPTVQTQEKNTDVRWPAVCPLFHSPLPRICRSSPSSNPSHATFARLTLRPSAFSVTTTYKDESEASSKFQSKTCRFPKPSSIEEGSEGIPAFPWRRAVSLASEASRTRLDNVLLGGREIAPNQDLPRSPIPSRRRPPGK